jgi:IstB-like ATP binding protein
VNMVPTETQTCRRCGRRLSWEPVTLFGRRLALEPTICTACAELGQDPTKPSRWERICPDAYQRTEIARLIDDLGHQHYDVKWLEGILSWQYGSEGLLVVGPTGVGKSRAMWLLLRRLLDQERRTVVWLNAVRFRTGLQAAARDGATEYFVRRLLKAHVVYWDDFGQTNLTGAASEMLLHLIEERTTAARPILATTQYSGDRLGAQFERPEMGQAIRRRINEFCKVVIVEQTSTQDCA